MMSKRTRILLSVVISVVLFCFLFFLNPLSLPGKSNTVLSITILMLSLWFTETLPVGWVAIIPLVAFPLLQIMPIEQAALNYIHNVVFLFFGGFLLGLGIEKSNLHKRIALGIVKITGTSPNRIILGFAISVGLLSMWLSNTATTMMMYPIGASVIALIELNYKGSGKIKNFSLVLMLLIAYASNIGGIATLIGTPPNTVFKGIMEKEFSIPVGFLQWSAICFPLAVVVLWSTYFLLTHVMYPNKMEKNAIPKSLIHDEYIKLGKMSRQEWLVTLIFLQTSLLWIFKDLIVYLFARQGIDLKVTVAGWVFKFDDSMIAMWGALLMFTIPYTTSSYKPVLKIFDLKKMQWGILLLFGGGLCLAAAMEKSGLMQLVGDKVAHHAGANDFVMVLALTFTAIFLSELMSNVALVAVFVPVVGTIAIAMKADPLLYCIPVTLGASCAYMLPMGTPPNAIVYASKKIKLHQMATAGFFLNIISGLLIAVFSYFLINLVF